MSHKIVLSKSVFENVLKHLVEMEEQKNKILDECMPDPCPKREELDQILTNYIEKMGILVQKIQVEESASEEFPFVIVNTEVEVEDLDEKDTLKFHIVPPFHGETTGEGVSCLSPVGKLLLLKRPGDRVEVKAPGGVFHYKIKSIKYANGEALQR